MRKLIFGTMTAALLLMSSSAWAFHLPTFHPPAPKPASVPELDPSAAAAAVALIAGGMAVVHGRRRRTRD